MSQGHAALTKPLRHGLLSGTTHLHIVQASSVCTVAVICSFHYCYALLVLPKHLEALAMNHGPDALGRTKSVPIAHGCRRKPIWKS